MSTLTTVSNVLTSIAVAAFAVALWKLSLFLIAFFTSPLRDLPGPPSSSFLYGNLREIRDSEPSVMYESWVERYGPTIKFKTWFNRDRLFTVDERAINHILTHSYDYPKPASSRFHLSNIVGKGVLVVEGEQHRVQRRVMNPAFGPGQIRELTQIFVEKAHQLCSLWHAEIAKHGQPARIEVTSGLSKMTLDVIGLAGFNYHFNALKSDGKPNELMEAFSVMFKSVSSGTYGIFLMLKAYIPILRFFPDAYNRRTERAQSAMNRIGMKLIADKKAEVINAANAGEKDNKLHSRDLLTLLIKANMSADIPESQRMSDQDVLAQVPTFLVAGHETTSTSTTWCLYALARAPDVQQKLREELQSIPTENPTMDELNELPYLEAVVRETLRVHAPVVSTARIAGKDDVIPLNTPYTDVYGQVHDSIQVKKGDQIQVPILAINRSKTVWGEDAAEFKPERWESIPKNAEHVPGVWGHLMSFLGGPRACIGYRFSLVEMKALVFALIRNFEFELAVSPAEITKRSAIVQRPYVRSQMDKGAQLPMLLKPCARN